MWINRWIIWTHDIILHVLAIIVLRLGCDIQFAAICLKDNYFISTVISFFSSIGLSNHLRNRMWIKTFKADFALDLKLPIYQDVLIPLCWSAHFFDTKSNVLTYSVKNVFDIHSKNILGMRAFWVFRESPRFNGKKSRARITSLGQRFNIFRVKIVIFDTKLIEWI